jgi:hypothetical protein
MYHDDFRVGLFVKHHYIFYDEQISPGSNKHVQNLNLFINPLCMQECGGSNGLCCHNVPPVTNSI